MRKILLLVAAVALTSCGTKNVASKVPTTPAPPGGANPHQGTSCPQAPLPMVEAVTLLFGHAVPALVSVRVAGETTFRYNECTPGVTGSGPIFTVSRPNVTELLVTINLNHSTDVGNQTLLPATEQFDVLDCKTNTVISAGKTAMPLTWAYSQPNGPTCLGQNVGVWSGAATPASADDELEQY